MPCCSLLLLPPIFLLVSTSSLCQHITQFDLSLCQPNAAMSPQCTGHNAKRGGDIAEREGTGVGSATTTACRAKRGEGEGSGSGDGNTASTMHITSGDGSTATIAAAWGLRVRAMGMAALPPQRTPLRLRVKVLGMAGPLPLHAAPILIVIMATRMTKITPSGSTTCASWHALLQALWVHHNLCQCSRWLPASALDDNNDNNNLLSNDQVLSLQMQLFNHLSLVVLWFSIQWCLQLCIQATHREGLWWEDTLVDWCLDRDAEGHLPWRRGASWCSWSPFFCESSYGSYKPSDSDDDVSDYQKPATKSAEKALGDRSSHEALWVVRQFMAMQVSPLFSWEGQWLWLWRIIWWGTVWRWCRDTSGMTAVHLNKISRNGWFWGRLTQTRSMSGKDGYAI